ncbi:MAG: hypothetical protein ACYCX6_05510 [Vulcanimicrobiaceae bacterium]
MQRLEGPTLWAIAFIASGLIGASVVLGVTLHNFSLEVGANLGVALGTIALAFFTWESVRKTNAVIASEDRRHQQGFAPLLVAQDVPGSGSVRITLANLGMGMARNIAVYVIGTHSGSNFKQGVVPMTNWEPIAGGVREGLFSVIPQPPIALSKLQDAPLEETLGPGNKQYDRFIAKQVFLAYEDMFGNHYSTTYDDFETDKSFEWVQPDNLRATTEGGTPAKKQSAWPERRRRRWLP